MSDLYWLTDEQMARLQPYFPKSHNCETSHVFIDYSAAAGRDWEIGPWVMRYRITVLKSIMDKVNRSFTARSLTTEIQRRFRKSLMFPTSKGYHRD